MLEAILVLMHEKVNANIFDVSSAMTRNYNSTQLNTYNRTRGAHDKKNHTHKLSVLKTMCTCYGTCSNAWSDAGDNKWTLQKCDYGYFYIVAVSTLNGIIIT